MAYLGVRDLPQADFGSRRIECARARLSARDTFAEKRKRNMIRSIAYACVMCACVFTASARVSQLARMYAGVDGSRHRPREARKTMTGWLTHFFSIAHISFSLVPLGRGGVGGGGGDGERKL